MPIFAVPGKMRHMTTGGWKNRIRLLVHRLRRQ
jgi:hypothetical protein